MRSRALGCHQSCVQAPHWRSTPSLRANQKLDTCCTIREARMSNESEDVNNCSVDVASMAFPSLLCDQGELCPA